MSVCKSRWCRWVGAAILSLGTFSLTKIVVADEVYSSPDALSYPINQVPEWRVRGGLGIADIATSSKYDMAPMVDLAVQKTIDDQVAVELGYAFFGDFDHTDLDRSIEVQAFKIAAVGYSPYKQHHRYFFRVGGFYSDVQANSAGVSAASTTDPGFFTAFGVSCKVAEKMSVTSEINYLFSSSNFDVAQLVIGLEYDVF